MIFDNSAKVTPVSAAKAAAPADATETVKYAYEMKNTVQGTYTNANRAGYRMENTNAVLTHLLKGTKTASLTDKQGRVFAENTFKTFRTDKSGIRHYFENSTETGRVNTIRLGEYYYDCHVRDFRSGSFKVDKNYHVYGDRIYQQYSIYSDNSSAYFGEFGCEIMIPAANVEDLETADTYAAFIIKDTGVLGFIGDNIAVEKIGGNYFVTQTAVTEEHSVPKYDEADYPYVTFGSRIYTDSSDNFEGVKRAAYEEYNPLSVTVGENNARCVFDSYDRLRGCYTFECDGTDFNIYYRDPSFHFNMPFTFTGDDTDRKVYVRFFGSCGCLESAALLDENDVLCPADVEVCKNFCGDGGEDFYSVKDFQYGDSFVPLVIEAGKDNTWKMLHVYCDWGTFPQKQLSSIEFHTSYYHISTGTTESNCIAPYYVFAKDGWTLPDFRCASGNIWAGQPQFNSVGILKFVVQNGKYGEFAGSIIDSAGKAYIDVTDSYVSDNGAYTYSTRHVEFPQRDENRTFYNVRIDFNEDVTIKDFSDKFDIFSFNGRFVAFNKLGYLDVNNVPSELPANTGGRENRVLLGGDRPYFGLYSCTDETKDDIVSGFGCNFAMIIRDSKIICGGEEKDIPFAIRFSGKKNNSDVALTLDADKLAFKAGDSMEFNVILLPWGVGTETDDSTVRNVRNEQEMILTASIGEKVADSIVPAVRVNEEGKAEFTVTGGNNNIAVRVDGITSPGKPVIEKADGSGTFAPYDVSVHGYDGYSVTVADDGTYSVSFVFAADGSAQTFRFSA